MAVHHIHPHIVNHGTHNDHQQSRSNDHNDIFKNLDHIFHSSNPQQTSHSFTATYSNQNGHVTKHFSKDGQSVDGDQAQNMMRQMHQEMKNMDHIFNNHLGINDDTGFGNLDQMIGNHHHQSHHPFHRLVNHFKH